MSASLIPFLSPSLECCSISIAFDRCGFIERRRKFHDSSIAALNEKMTGDRRTAACGRKAWPRPSILHIGSKADRVSLGNHSYAFLLL